MNNIKSYLSAKAINLLTKNIGISNITIKSIVFHWDKNYPNEEPCLIVEYSYMSKNKKIHDGSCIKFSELKNPLIDKEAK